MNKQKKSDQNSQGSRMGKFTAVARKCSKCGKVLLAEMFGKNASNNDGLTCQCNKCRARTQKEANKRYRKAHPEVGKEYRQAHREKFRLWDALYRGRHRSEIIARNGLNHAIVAGKITRPSRCEFCGKECTPHGHHEDYSLPLAVVWLCNDCHKIRDRALKEVFNEEAETIEACEHSS